MAGIDDLSLCYESDSNGEKQLVRSVEANRRAYLRFTNKTRRPVDVWWRDYNGQKVFYANIAPGGYYDVNTFLTHPWHFTDAGTHENYVVNNLIFFRAPPAMSMTHRTNWNVTIGVRSLRMTTLLSIATVLKNPTQVPSLGLPTVLEEELRDTICALYGLPTEPDPQ